MKPIFLVLLLFTLYSCNSAKDKLVREIRKGEEKLFSDSLSSFDKVTAEAVFANYVSYAEKFKDDTLSALYLFKAGDLSNGLGRPKEAIAIFERLRTTYPDFRKSSTALFMQAFIYETAIHDKERAKEKYSEFIAKYPEHQLAPSAKASLSQLNANLSDEDLIRMFEEKNKSAGDSTGNL